MSLNQKKTIDIPDTIITNSIDGLNKDFLNVRFTNMFIKYPSLE